jgi:hypothetical protein
MALARAELWCAGSKEADVMVELVPDLVEGRTSVD